MYHTTTVYRVGVAAKNRSTFEIVLPSCCPDAVLTDVVQNILFHKPSNVGKSIFSGPNFDHRARTNQPTQPKTPIRSMYRPNRNVCVFANKQKRSKPPIPHERRRFGQSIHHAHPSHHAKRYFSFYNSAPYSKGAGSKWTRSHTRKRGVTFYRKATDVRSGRTVNRQVCSAPIGLTLLGCTG
jgi:hypothetical protein